ncbi:MAG: CRTAC1 family protein [Alphaproteobacteria bacterium]
MKNKRSTLGSLATFAAIACAGPAFAAAEAPHFVEEAASAGIEHRYEGGWTHTVGGGVAAFDCSGDGRPELYFAGGENTSVLYLNASKVGGPLAFVPVMDSGTVDSHVTGAYPLDIDGDGHLDLAVLRVGENVLYRGLGDCRFERANERWGFDGGAAWTTGLSATWQPGQDWPTLAVGNYVDREAEGAPWGTCHDNILHLPTATDEGFRAPTALSPGYCSLSLLFSDWNRSGRADLRISNDRQYYRGGSEQLWRIAPADVAPRPYGAGEGWQHLRIWGMGIASHDVTGDGYPEYFITSMGDNKLRTLKHGAERPHFTDIARAQGVTAHHPYVGDTTRPSTAWHAEFADVNNDGLVDLFVAKGNVGEMDDFALEDPNNLLLGQPGGGFAEAGAAAGVASGYKARGGAVVDLNLDGMLDLVVVNRDGPAEVWRNLGSGEADAPVAIGHWVQLRLRQPGGNRDAIGAWVELQADGIESRKELTVGGGHAGGQLGWIHFGLASADRARVRVRWPGGKLGPWMDVSADRFVIIERGADEPAAWSVPD